MQGIPTSNSIPPRLATALVKAQTHTSRFVANDRCGPDGEYNYASHEAIALAAQRICVDTGLGLLLAGHRTTTMQESPPGADCLWILVPVVIFHESGEALQAFQLGVPMRGTLDEAIADAQRAAYAQVLGLRWNNPGDEALRARLADEFRWKKITVDVDVGGSGDDFTGPADDEPEPVDPEVVEKSRGALQVLRTQFGFESVDLIYATATGCPPEWPAKPTAIEYMAVAQLALLCEELADRARNIPRTHAHFLSESAWLGYAHLSPIFTNGCPTKDVQD